MNNDHDHDPAEVDRHLRAAALRRGVDRTRANDAARRRALARLAGRHPDEYRALYRDEVTKPAPPHWPAEGDP